MQWPLIPAMTSLSMRSIAVIASSQRIRSGCVSSPVASALRSTPVWNARPAPVMTTTRTSRRAAIVETASPRSVAKRALPAFSTCGRSNVRRATGPRTSSRIVASVIGQWFTIKGLVTSLTALLCLTTFSNLVASGAFPAVLPDIARSAALAWNTAFLVACGPQLAAIAIVPRLLSSLPAQPSAASLFARQAPSGTPAATLTRPRGGASMVPLAFAAGGLVALTYSTMEQFVVPLRGSREFGLERAGVARLFMVQQVFDIAALIPTGILADRQGATRVLPGVLLLMAAGNAMIGFGALPVVVAGCALFGLSMSGWMLPLTLLRRDTEPERIAWRTGLYRVCVDGGIFLGPFLSGVLGMRLGGILPAISTTALALTALLLLTRARSSGTMAIHG